MDRRLFLASVGAMSTMCVERPKPAAAPATNASAEQAPAAPKDPRTVEVLDWTFPTEFGGPKRATVLLPRPTNEKLPVLVALHGLGETTDPVTGANAWPKSYALDHAYQRLLEPPLHPDDLQNLVTSERLSEINESLMKRALGGLIVVCPYLPKDIGGAFPIELYAQWLGERVLPRVRNELPAMSTVNATGIDGVSLGGWSAIRIAMARPDLFGVVGALQPALIDGPMVEWAASILGQHLKGRPFRFVTSTEDLYRYTLTELDKKLTAKSVPHEFLMTPGPHDYPWNRGPGAIEMLLWHDRILRGG
jgi:iron(III)-salmochelin esterase